MTCKLVSPLLASIKLLQLTSTHLPRQPFFPFPHRRPAQALPLPAQLHPSPATQLALESASRDERSPQAPLSHPFVSMSEVNVEKGDQGKPPFTSLTPFLFVCLFFKLFACFRVKRDVRPCYSFLPPASPFWVELRLNPALTPIG